MPRLRLLAAGPGAACHDGEVLACACTLDGAFVLSGGWDGHLRLWEMATGNHVAAVLTGNKPVTACCVSPDGRQWLSGSMDGLLATWDASTQQQRSIFLAHTRPISAILFAADGRTRATASWDRNLTLWNGAREREGQALTGHGDIVAGCRFTPDGQTLLSWSYDGTLRLWDLAPKPSHRGTLTGHTDRVTAGAASPDLRWASSGARDGELKLWDLSREREAASSKVSAEVRACFFLLDGESLVAVDANGRLTVHALPDLAERRDLTARVPVQCAELSPSGAQIVLGCGDGRLRFVAVEGTDGAPLIVTATQTSKRSANFWQRLLGRSRVRRAYCCTCPACQQGFDLPGSLPGQPAPCPRCGRPLRFNPVARVFQEEVKRV